MVMINDNALFVFLTPQEWKVWDLPDRARTRRLQLHSTQSYTESERPLLHWTLHIAHLHQQIVSTQHLHPLLQCAAAPAPQCAARPSALRSASALLPHITPQPHQITARPPAVQPSSSFCNESISLQCASTFLPLVMLKSFKESTVLLLFVAMRPGTEFIIIAFTTSNNIFSETNFQNFFWWLDWRSWYCEHTPLNLGNKART